MGKYQSKMVRLCEWSSETKVIIVCDSFFRKPISIVHFLRCKNQPLVKPVRKIDADPCKKSESIGLAIHFFSSQHP